MAKKDEDMWTILLIVFCFMFLFPILPVASASSRKYFWQGLGIFIIVAGIVTMFLIR